MQLIKHYRNQDDYTNFNQVYISYYVHNNEIRLALNLPLLTKWYLNQ